MPASPTKAWRRAPGQPNISGTELAGAGACENRYGHARRAPFRIGRKPPGPRRLGRTVITTFGRDFATASTEFFLAEVVGVGRQGQPWVRLDEGWRITSAHVSFTRP